MTRRGASSTPTCYVAYCFESGWAVGKITEPLTDPTQTETVQDGDRTGERPRNFRIYFHADDNGDDDDDAASACLDMLLMVDQYTDRVDAEPGEWCLMAAPASKKRSKAAGKQPMANDLPSVEQLRDYSSYELQELRARLDDAGCPGWFDTEVDE